MSIQTDPHAPAPAPAPVEPSGTGPSTWALTWHGVRTVALLELRQRIRSTRWVVSLVLFGLLVGAVTLLTWHFGVSQDAGAQFGPTMFGLIVFFVLFLGLLVAPALSSTAINGDRAAGTLATLQVTLLSAAEIAVGKLLAAWLASLAFLGVSVPFIIWAFALGGTSPVAVLVTLLLLALLLAVICAVGLGFSAVTARTSASTVLTYVAVTSVALLSVIFFGLTMPLVSDYEEVQVYREPWETWTEEDWREQPMTARCDFYTEEMYVAHTERNWWLLAINPFVVVADAAPRPAVTDEYMFAGDPLSAIREGVRSARLGPPEFQDWCPYPDQTPAAAQRDDVDLPPVWPWGLGAHLLLGTGALAVAVRRLQIPQKKLTRGTRVA